MFMFIPRFQFGRGNLVKRRGNPLVKMCKNPAFIYWFPSVDIGGFDEVSPCRSTSTETAPWSCPAATMASGENDPSAGRRLHVALFVRNRTNKEMLRSRPRRCACSLRSTRVGLLTGHFRFSRPRCAGKGSVAHLRGNGSHFRHPLRNVWPALTDVNLWGCGTFFASHFSCRLEEIRVHPQLCVGFACILRENLSLVAFFNS